MNGIKIIFFDVDGTLLAFDKKGISEKTQEVLNKLKEKHYILALATGRAPLSIPKFEGG